MKNDLEIVEKDGLVQVYENPNGEKLVDARELHEFLGVGRDFTTWIKNRIEKYGFIENLDYVITLTKTGERSNVIKHDYILKLDMAKELAMVENNDKGRMARRYFIEIEKKFRQLAKPESIEDLIIMQAESMKQMRKEISEAKEQISSTVDTISEIKQALIDESPQWRKEMNNKVKRIGAKLGDYRRAWNESYQELEKRARCNLDRRLQNMLERMRKAGVPKKQLSQTGYLDVISLDERLKQIYTSIVKEMSIKYMD